MCVCVCIILSISYYIAYIVTGSTGDTEKKEKKETTEGKKNHNYRRVANFSHGVHGYLCRTQQRVIYVSFISVWCVCVCVYVRTGRRIISNNGVREKKKKFILQRNILREITDD